MFKRSVGSEGGSNYQSDEKAYEDGLNDDDYSIEKDQLDDGDGYGDYGYVDHGDDQW